MLKFKKEFENHSIALADGTLINKETISSDYVQSKLAASPSFAYMLESDSVKPAFSEEVKAVSETTKKKVRK